MRRLFIISSGMLLGHLLVTPFIGLAQTPYWVCAYILFILGLAIFDHRNIRKRKFTLQKPINFIIHVVWSINKILNYRIMKRR